jgi:branched-chain amino acid transport system ATP-binding protein
LASSLTIDGIHAGYGAVRVIEDVSITVGAGETVVLLGTNGNGKSTLMKCVMGLVRPSAGSIVADIDGVSHDLAKLTTEEIVDLGIALVPEGRRLFADMTVIDNLRMGAYTPHARADEARRLERQLELFPRLAERRDQLARTMSGGEQQMLAVARALMSAPKLLLLDEPSLGLSPRLVKDLFAILRAIGRSGQSVVLVEQNVRQSLRLADHVYVLENGRIERSGSVAEIEKDAAIQKAYLGIAPERQPAQPKAPARERQSAGGFVNPFARSVAARSLNGQAEERSMANQQDGPAGSGFFHPFARTVAQQSAKPSPRPAEAPEPRNSAQPAATPAEPMPIPTSGGFVNPQARAPKQ